MLSASSIYLLPVPARLLVKLVGGVISSLVFFGVPLFLGARSLHWPRGWVLCGVVLVASAVTMFGIFPSRPDLLDERYKAPIQKGQPLKDKVLTPMLAAAFVGFVLFLGLDATRFRLLGATSLPVALLGLAMFGAGWTACALALRENAFAAPVVKHQGERGQFVVQTGPYRFVRHPMYAGAVFLFAGMAMWLGSAAGVIASAVPVGILVVRIWIEEGLLRRDLPGYEDYANKVRWRLIPFVW